MYGPGVADDKSPRRSIYLRVKRSKLSSSMVSFDQPEPLASQGLRPTTTVAPQALILMNSTLARNAAAALAARVTKSAGEGAPPERLIEEAYAVALSRAPLPEESALASDFLQAQTGRLGGASRTPTQAASEAFAHFCQVLLETNEFVYLP
jgi:hypothetical protein